MNPERESLLREAGRDIPLMRENIAAGYMPEASQAVIDEYQRRLAALPHFKQAAPFPV